jgi:glycosyltransferase involved in cell wall biosynthesis
MPAASPLPLVFIQKTAVRGGAINRLLDTLLTLQRGTSHPLHAVCAEEGEFTERCAALGIPLTRHPLPEWRKLTERLRFHGAIRSLSQKLPFQEAAWVISNEMWWAPHAAALAKRLKARSAAILRDGIADVRKGRKYRLQDHDLILPSSLKIARGLQSDPQLAQRTHVFLDAVFLPPERETSAAILQGQTADVNAAVKRWLLVIGRVQPRKKQTDAVRVLRGLLDRGHADFGLLVAGDCEPGYDVEMESVIRECQVQDRVVMLGNFSDIRALFAFASVCLLTSLREALPGSVMEALLAAKPCFMYPCEGAEDIFGDHRERFVSADFKPELMVEQIDRMLRSPIVLADEVQRLCQRAEGLFSYEAHLRSLRERLGLDLRAGAWSSQA